MSDKCPTHSQSGGVILFIANSVQGHAPPSPIILFHAHAWAVMPRMDEVMGIGQSDVGRSATTNSPHPLDCLLYTSPSPRDVEESRMPSSA